MKDNKLVKNNFYHIMGSTTDQDSTVSIVFNNKYISITRKRLFKLKLEK